MRIAGTILHVLICHPGWCQQMLGCHPIKVTGYSPHLELWGHDGHGYEGLPSYMNHQVWRPDFNDARGLGGNQIKMALSSWMLLYPYSDNGRVMET